MPNRNPRSLILFWLHWILANATSVGVAHALVGWVATSENSPRLLLVLIPLTLATPFLIAYGQQVLLQRWLPNVDYWFALMPLNLAFGFAGLAVGGMIGWVVVDLFRPFPIGPLTFLIALTSVSLGYGAGFGVLQALCLRLSPQGSMLWFAANGAGFSLALFTEVVLWGMASQNSTHWTTVGACSLLGTVGGVAYGLITGGALIWLLPARA